MTAMAKTYRIPVCWKMYGYVSVTADALQEAIDYALHEETPLPEGNYEDGSLCLDEEALEIFEDTSELKRGG